MPASEPPRTLILGLPFAHPTCLAWSSKCNAVSLTQPHGWRQDLVLPSGRGLFLCPSWWKRSSEFSFPTSKFSLRRPIPTSWALICSKEFIGIISPEKRLEDLARSNLSIFINSPKGPPFPFPSPPPTQ